MTQNTNHTDTYHTDEISDLIKSIAAHGERAIRDINRLNEIVPKARIEIAELVDEAENNITLRCEVERLSEHIQHDLRHRVTTRESITDQFVDNLISASIAYGSARMQLRDTAKLSEALDVFRTNLATVDFVDLFDAAIRYGLVRARRQRSAQMIRGTVEEIRALI